jgi:hypothetical protein
MTQSTALPIIDCQRILLEGSGNALEYVSEAQSRGLCATQQPIETTATAPQPPVKPTLQNNISSGGGIPWILLAGAAIAAITVGLEKASSHGAKRRNDARRVSHALTGGYVGQASLGTATGEDEYQYPQDIQDIHPYSDSNSGAAYTPSDSGFTEPIPWGMTEGQQATYQADRTASDLSTESCWAYLKKSTVSQFQEKVGPGEIDPVAVQEGLGKVTARDACNSWFAHGIAEIGKVGWAVFGCDGQGGTARAKATAALVKAFRDEYHAIAL